VRYYLDPFGCVKNQVDAETMMAVLNGSGWVPSEDAAGADLIIVNSCGFIESAKRESINAVLAWRKIYPRKKILLAGCLARRYARELAQSLPEADLLFAGAGPAGIAAAAALALAGNSPEEYAAPSPDESALPSPGKRPLLSPPGSAYVKIAEGCDNRCSFCAIPLIRGGLRSRAISSVTEECRTLLARGVRELCLIGQDLGSYGRDLGNGGDTGGNNAGGNNNAGTGGKLPELLEALSALEGRFWIRLLYLHPDNFPAALPDICRRDGRILPYFDIPFQHGSEGILRAMGRRGNAGSYLALIEKIRTALPDAVIRSTFMTGFPGETQAGFEALLDFQDRARLDWLGVFAYSREEDTPAYTMKGRVSKRTAEERKKIIEARQIPITESRMDRFVGRTMEVLVEEPVKGEELFLGRLYCQAPEVDGAAVIHARGNLTPGTLVRARVFARAGFDLEAAVGEEER
jgi:ribosomal protein S12 methylthiotransferase